MAMVLTYPFSHPLISVQSGFKKWRVVEALEALYPVRGKCRPQGLAEKAGLSDGSVAEGGEDPATSP